MSLYEIFTLNVAHCIHIYPNFETETRFNANFIRILSEIYSKVVIVALFFIPSSLRKCRASSPLSKFCCRSSVRTSEFGADGEKRKKFEPRVASRPCRRRVARRSSGLLHLWGISLSLAFLPGHSSRSFSPTPDSYRVASVATEIVLMRLVKFSACVFTFQYSENHG